MNCNQCKNNLSAYIDEEVNFLNGWRIKKHLKTCPECKKEWIKLKNIRKISKVVLLKNPEPDFYKRLKERLPRKEKISRAKIVNLKTVWITLPLPGKAAFVAGLAIILFLSLIYPRFLLVPDTLSIEQFEEEYLRSREMLSFAEGPTPSIILVQE